MIIIKYPPGSTHLPSSLCTWSHFILLISRFLFNGPTVRTKEPRHSKVELLAQGHTAIEWEIGFQPSSLVPAEKAAVPQKGTWDKMLLGGGGVLSNEGCGRTGIQPFQTNAWTLMQRLYKGPSPVSSVWETAWSHRCNTGPNQSEKAGCPETWLACTEKTHCPAPPSWAVVPISEL